jgi:hypothetical protein
MVNSAVGLLPLKLETNHSALTCYWAGHFRYQEPQLSLTMREQRQPSINAADVSIIVRGSRGAPRRELQMTFVEAALWQKKAVMPN